MSRASWVAVVAGLGVSAAVVPWSPVRAAGPATRSAAATKPAHTVPTAHVPPTTPSGWVKQVNATYHFTYATPKTWKPSGASDTSTQFTAPAVGKAQAAGGTLAVAVTTAARATTLDAAADEVRSKAAADAMSKVAKDEKTTLGDRDAWLFEVDQLVKSDVPGAKPNQKPRTVTRVGTRTFTVVAVNGDAVVSVTFAAEGSPYASGLSVVKQVLGTFAWTPVPAAAAPTTAPKK